MVVIWLLILLICIALIVINFRIITTIIDFQIDHVNPIDVCTSLSKNIQPLFILLSSNIVLSILKLFKAWPLIIVNAGLLVFFYLNKKKRNRYFEPMTIVRDSDHIKNRHIVVLVLNAFSFIYALVMTLLEAMK